MKPSISVIVPAFNEERNIASTLEAIIAGLQGRCGEYEILVFDDFSNDETGSIADSWASKNPRIRVIHNKSNKGFGYNYRAGVAIARCDYISMIPGDNEIAFDSISSLYDAVGSAEIIIPYTTNYWVRPLKRRFISRSFTLLMNLLFGLRLRYFNGPVIHRRDLISSVGLSTDSFAFQAEALVKLLKKNHTFRQVAIELNKKPAGTSKAFRFKNICGVLRCIARLFYEIRIQKKF